ncbi:FAD-dependent oxidoreductase [Nonomuraea sp. NPDC052129]|uniref:FAD-dependent oxidoreductase n=1 Tax=Nonomuraea sp. NPDC052129 TaxID=3154651 RepID=UPI003421D0FB
MNDGAAQRGPVLNDEQFRRLAAYGEVEHAEAGRDLYVTGDDAYDFFLLLTATVDIVRDATAIEPKRLIFHGGPGDFLGELNLLTGQHVYLTARVVSAGTVVRIGAAKLRRALAEQDDIADLVLAAFRERREVIRSAAGEVLEIVGQPETAATLELRTYVTQMLLPHTWRSATSHPGRSLMTAAGLTADDLPAAIVGGSVLRRATSRTVAELLGLIYRANASPVDLVVVGAGPAGLAAAVYGASEGLATVLLDRSGLGGQAAKSARIENYLGFPHGVSGANLTRLAMIQALKSGVRIHSPCAVTGLDLSDDRRPTVLLEDGVRIPCRAVIAATGAHYRRLDIPQWATFEKSGCIRYAATELDVREYEHQPVAVIGGNWPEMTPSRRLSSRGRASGRNGWLVTHCSASSEPTPCRAGCPASPRPTTASSSSTVGSPPARPARAFRSRRAFPGSSRSATSARARRNEWPRPSAMARARSPPYTWRSPATDMSIARPDLH